MYNQNKMPLVQAVKTYLSKNYLRMHMPGHKGHVASEIQDLLGDKPFNVDLTELPGTDNLHSPSEAIAEAESLAASLFGAKHTIFLVNGATQGIIALMMLDMGKKIILPRHAHKALYNGLVLSGAKPIYIEPRYSPTWGIALGSEFNNYCSIAANNLDAKQVWLTSPTYFGHIEDVQSYKRFLPDNAKLFVDEAHGSHLRFMGHVDAIGHGAHASVQSWHKTLGSLTQSSVIHFSTDDYIGNVRQNIALTETTSPSYLLLLSLDAARKRIAECGKEILLQSLTNIKILLGKLHALNHVTILQTDDITKMAIRVKGMSGYQLFDFMMEKGIMPEMAQEKFVLLQLSLSFTSEDVDKIFNVLREVTASGVVTKSLNIEIPELPEMQLLPREAFFAEKMTVPFKEAAGKICGEFITPYPPGIPVLVPGEMITIEILDYLKNLSCSGAYFQGNVDKKINYLQVIKE